MIDQNCIPTFTDLENEKEKTYSLIVDFCQHFHIYWFSLASIMYKTIYHWWLRKKCWSIICKLHSDYSTQHDIPCHVTTSTGEWPNLWKYCILRPGFWHHLMLIYLLFLNSDSPSQASQQSRHLTVPCIKTWQFKGPLKRERMISRLCLG